MSSPPPGMETSGAAYTSTKSGIATQLDALYGVPGSSTSLDGTLNTFTESLQELAANPTSAAARTTVLGNASAVASLINSAAGTVQNLRTGLEAQLGNDTSAASTILSNIATLNGKIQNTTDSTALTDLQDQRDQAINSLSSYMDVQTVPQRDGTVSVMTQSGVTLVDRGNAATLSFDGRGVLGPNATYSTDPAQRTVGTITATLPGADPMSVAIAPACAGVGVGGVADPAPAPRNGSRMTPACSTRMYPRLAIAVTVAGAQPSTARTWSAAAEPPRSPPNPHLQQSRRQRAAETRPTGMALDDFSLVRSLTVETRADSPHLLRTRGVNRRARFLFRMHAKRSEEIRHAHHPRSRLLEAR